MTGLASVFKDRLRGWRSRREFWLLAAAAAFLLLLLAAELRTIFRIDVWRFDAVYYFDSYYYKLRTEGRWIDYLLFPLLKHIPAQLSILAHLFCLWFFGYSCCREFTEDRAYAAIFGLALLQIHPYFSIFGWPVTTLPTFLLLALLAWQRRVLPMPWFFIAAGVLFHGGFNNFYDLLPLLFLREISERDLDYLLKLFAWWCAGYVAGFAVAEAAVFTASLSFIEIAPWRRPHPVRSLADLCWNAQQMAGYFTAHVQTLLLRGWTQFALGAGLGVALCGSRRRPAAAARLCAALAAVILSVYVQTLPIGIKVALRTAFPLYIGAVSVFILAGRTRAKTAAVVLLCLLAFGLFQDDVKTAEYYYTVTSTFRNEFRALCGDPPQYSGVRFIATEYDMKRCVSVIVRRNHLENRLTEGFGSAIRWVPVAQSCGIRDVTFTESSASLAPSDPDCIYSHEDVGNYLILGVNPAFLKANHM